MANCSSSAASRQLGSRMARRRGVNSNLLFRWIGQLRPDSWVTGRIPLCFCRNPPWTSFRWVCFGDDEGTSMTIPVSPSAGAPPVASSARPKSVLPAKGPTLEERPGVIEIDFANGVRVRVDAFVNEKALRRVAAALGT